MTISQSIVFNGTEEEFASALKYAIVHQLGCCMIPMTIDPVADDAVYDSHNAERNQRFIDHQRAERKSDNEWLEKRVALVVEELRQNGRRI